MSTTTNSEEVIRELYNKVFMIYGIPKYLQTDNASCFTSHSFKEFLASHNVQHMLTSPYMPTSNGRIERTNQSVLNLLRCLATDNPDKWTDYLPAVCNALNNAYSATTKTSPNVMIFGRQTRTAFDIDLSNTIPHSDHLQNLLELQQYASEQAWANRNQHNIKDKIEHDKNLKESDLQIGHLVYWVKPQLDPQKSYKLQERAR